MKKFTVILTGAPCKTMHPNASHCKVTIIDDMKNAVFNTPGRIRTCDLRFRKPTLYPTELRAL